MSGHVILRPETDADLPYLESLYAGSRWEELEPLPWPDSVKTSFLGSQFRTQRLAHRSGYPAATFDIVEINGLPAGRLYVERRTDEIRIIDLLLEPQYRGMGLGSRLLGEILTEASRSGLPVTLHVEASNPAVHLFRRLGFVAADTTGVYHFMVRHPGPLIQRTSSSPCTPSTSPTSNP